MPLEGGTFGVGWDPPPPLPNEIGAGFTDPLGPRQPPAAMSHALLATQGALGVRRGRAHSPRWIGSPGALALTKACLGPQPYRALPEHPSRVAVSLRWALAQNISEYACQPDPAPSPATSPCTNPGTAPCAPTTAPTRTRHHPCYYPSHTLPSGPRPVPQSAPPPLHRL